MSRARLDRLEAAMTQGDGIDEDLCPACGGLNITTLLLQADAIEPDPLPTMDEPVDKGDPEKWVEMAEARCRRCGAPTLSALIAWDFLE